MLMFLNPWSHSYKSEKLDISSNSLKSYIPESLGKMADLGKSIEYYSFTGFLLTCIFSGFECC